MKVMTAVQKTSTYLLHLEEPQRSTMCPVSRMPHLIQLQLHHAVLKNIASDLYAGDHHTALLMMLTPQKMKLLHLTSVHKYNITDPTLEHQLPSTLLVPMYIWKKMKKRISKPSPWMMNIGQLRKSLTDLCAYTNIPYNTDYAHTHVHMQITRLLPTLRPWN